MALTLKQARRLKEKSQEDMAEVLKIHVNTYRRLEENPNNTTIEQAKKISSYLEIPYDKIFFAG
jgi:DNA-binding XRE family transcriptional regulator